MTKRAIQTLCAKRAHLYFEGLRMFGFVFEPNISDQAQRMLAEHYYDLVQTVLTSQEGGR